MRILQLHSNFIFFKPIEKEINIAEEAAKEETRVEEVVVLFTAIEEGDNSTLAQKAIDDARAFLGKLKVNRILIYPLCDTSAATSSQPFSALPQSTQRHGNIRQAKGHRNLPCTVWLEQTIHHIHQRAPAG
jgi:hypothetical protein